MGQRDINTGIKTVIDITHTHTRTHTHTHIHTHKASSRNAEI